MSEDPVRFDSIFARVIDTLRSPKPRGIERVYVVRDLYGKVRIAVADPLEANEQYRSWLEGEAKLLCERLGPHGHPPKDAVLFLDDELMEELHRDAREVLPGVYWIDRLLTGRDWWTVSGDDSDTNTYTLYSVKGGVGRSTSAAVLSWHLARRGEDVLVVDLDLESPGISSAMLDEPIRPEFGVVDWFVEDLVGQGDGVIADMIAMPSWHHDLPGDVRIVPAHGAQSGEYLAKLGRVYMDTDVRWTKRLEQLLSKLREVVEPTIVLLESRNGLHDIAAATVTDLDAHVLLFAIDSETTWEGYGILFEHWREQELARRIRQRLSIVSSLTPDIDTEAYIERFRERSWTLFQDHLYDKQDSPEESDDFTYDLLDDHAPHDPFVVRWTRGLAAGASLRAIEGTTVDQAYSGFLQRFDELMRVNRGIEP